MVVQAVSVVQQQMLARNPSTHRVHSVALERQLPIHNLKVSTPAQAALVPMQRSQEVKRTTFLAVIILTWPMEAATATRMAKEQAPTLIHWLTRKINLSINKI